MYDYFADPFADHTRAVAALMDSGIKPPTAWQKLITRWQAFNNSERGNYRAALADAVVNGGDTAELHALALAEAVATTVTHAEINNAVRAAVLAGLIDAYAPAALPNYLATADLFDAAAQRLAAATTVTDVEATADQIVTADNTIRSAWSDALLAAQDLDRIAATLVTAATLAGLHGNGDELLFALTTDPTATDRRTAWQAWDSSGRCGRWSALLNAGCTIRAHRDLAAVTPYRKPLPLEERWVRSESGIGHVRTMHDPELEATN